MEDVAHDFEPLRFNQRHIQSFEAWRDWWFGYLCRPNESEADKEPYWRLEVDSPYDPFGSATRAAQALTIVFESSSDLVSKFGLVAAAEGLWKIACPLTVRYGYSLWDPKSDATAVKRALTAMPTLFKDVFMQYCSYPAECSSDANDNPLNLTCYMWFDIIGLDCCELNEIPDERIRWALEALKAVLELPHIACQKSALHGLGHIAGYRPAIVKPIIAEFIGRSPKIPSNLQTYAERAAEGQVI